MQPLKFRNGYVISSHTLVGMWLLIHVGIKVKPCFVKVGPQSYHFQAIPCNPIDTVITWGWLFCIIMSLHESHGFSKFLHVSHRNCSRICHDNVGSGLKDILQWNLKKNTMKGAKQQWTTFMIYRLRCVSSVCCAISFCVIGLILTYCQTCNISGAFVDN